MKTVIDTNPPFWLKNKHIQSMVPFFKQGLPFPAIGWEELKLPDGDFIDLSWSGLDLPEDSPIVVIQHGLEGSIETHYMQSMISVLHANGWRTVAPHFRCCSGRVNRLTRIYTAGGCEDLSAAVNHIERRYSDALLFGVGFSLGGNILINYLSQYVKTPLVAGVAISTPFDVSRSLRALPYIYERRIVHSLKLKFLEKHRHGHLMPISKEQLYRARRLRDLDIQFNCVLFNYHSVENYYAASSCINYMPMIETPLLIINSLDDPFVPKDTIPDEKMLRACVEMELLCHGGHLGFLGSESLRSPALYAYNRTFQYLSRFI